MNAAVGFLIGLVLACNLAVLTVRLVDRSTDTFGPSTTAVEVSLRPDQATVKGDVVTFVAEGANVAALPTPVTLVPVVRGDGRITIEGALVAGERVTVSWDGGVPLPITGTGSIELSPTRVRVEGGSVVWHIDGAARRLAPGRYRLGAPVAVAARGLAEPRNLVELVADERTVLVARGEVVARTEPPQADLLGPGSVDVTGTLEVGTGSTTARRGQARLSDGAYRVSLVRAGDRYLIDALLQGRVTSG